MTDESKKKLLAQLSVMRIFRVAEILIEGLNSANTDENERGDVEETDSQTEPQD